MCTLVRRFTLIFIGFLLLGVSEAYWKLVTPAGTDRSVNRCPLAMQRLSSTIRILLAPISSLFDQFSPPVLYRPRLDIQRVRND